jgi:cytochrome c5
MKLAPAFLAAASLFSCCCLAADPPAQRTAEQILNQYCNVCHATGWNGAPISGDRTEWQPRLMTGFDALFKNARQGFNNMPPMGTCQDCTDAELKAAIEAMICSE